MPQTEKEKHLAKTAKLKAARYCAYRERTQREVREKLHQYGLYDDEAEYIISELITEGFINEERFAIAYAGGKFRLKKWGRLKIQQGLEQHGLTFYCVQKGLNSLDETSYHQTLENLLAKKWNSLEVSDLFVKKHKTAQFLINKGYEPELVWQQLKMR